MRESGSTQRKTVPGGTAIDASAAPYYPCAPMPNAPAPEVRAQTGDHPYPPRDPVDERSMREAMSRQVRGNS